MTSQEASTLSMFMRSVVTDGTGSGVRTDAYSVAGKTGSAEFETGKETHAWFTGFAPAEDPKVLALCIIYVPQGMYYGGIIAAPVVRSIFENVLPYLGIERTVTETPFGENRADGVD